MSIPTETERTRRTGIVSAPLSGKVLGRGGLEEARMGRRPGASTEERLWAKVDKDANASGCWLWRGRSNARTGHSNITRSKIEGGGSVGVHVLSYTLAYGPIPEGLELDHVCRVPACVRPDHLEAVTRQVNLLRGETLAAENAAKESCPKGHPYDYENTYHYRGYRYCRTCSGKRPTSQARAR